jgi:hypothetical protein
MTRLEAFSAPGHLNELSADGLRRWDRLLKTMFDTAAAGPVEDPTDSPRAQFYNPTAQDTAADAATASISWTAFPREVAVVSATDEQRWELADSKRDKQDEYCEWGVVRDASGKMTRAEFTCEVPEYFETLAADDPKQLLKTYQQLAGPEVRIEDLLGEDGAYNPRNKWNATTDKPPVHLIQENNKLSAAVELAAAASIVRLHDGTPLTSVQELIACSKYGASQRNSDPHIGAEVNALARQKARITLADPPGLYISDFSPVGWTTPDQTDAKRFWTYTRGEKGRRLRGVYEVPPEAGYAVGDILVGGQPLRFGAQIADLVSVKLIGLACDVGASTAAPFSVCKG